MLLSFPSAPAARDRYVAERRGARAVHDPWQYQGVSVEDERAADGTVVPVATVYLTGRECPWRCTMCDLWRFTTEADTPPGAIASQIRAARAALTRDARPPAHMKLYNAGSFFDPRAVPDDDYDEIATALDGLRHIIVESHPALVERGVDRLLASLGAIAGGTPSLEVAMGLETANPKALERLNKRMTVATFTGAAARLRERGVAVRAFLLILPPFIQPDEQYSWLAQSVRCAFSAGVSVVSLIPTRTGNGTMEVLHSSGLYAPARLSDVEDAFDLAHSLRPATGRLFVDLWDIETLRKCDTCAERRHTRLHAMNLTQQVLPRVRCDACGTGAS